MMVIKHFKSGMSKPFAKRARFGEVETCEGQPVSLTFFQTFL